MNGIITRPHNGVGFFPKYMRSFFEDLNRDVDGVQAPTAYVPRVDISEDTNNIYVHAELPGMTNENVKVIVSDGVLTLRGEKKHEEKTEGKKNEGAALITHIATWMQNIEGKKSETPASETTRTNGESGKSTVDPVLMFRRAVLLRALLESNLKTIIDDNTLEAQIDRGVVRQRQIRHAFR